MTVEEIMAKERWATEEATKGKVDALDEVFTQDVTIHEPPNPPHKGLDIFKQVFKAWGETFSDTHWDWKEVIIDGDTAVHRYVLRMKHTGSSAPFPWPPTGKQLELPGMAIYHVKDGKIVDMVIHEDLLGFFQQLGLIPPLQELGK